MIDHSGGEWLMHCDQCIRLDGADGVAVIVLCSLESFEDLCEFARRWSNWTVEEGLQLCAHHTAMRELATGLAFVDRFGWPA